MAATLGATIDTSTSAQDSNRAEGMLQAGREHPHLAGARRGSTLVNNVRRRRIRTSTMNQVGPLRESRTVTTSSPAACAFARDRIWRQADSHMHTAVLQVDGVGRVPWEEVAEPRRIYCAGSAESGVRV